MSISTLINIDFSSRISALRAVGLSIGVPANLLPAANAAISDIECLRWINLQRIAKSLPPLPGLDYHGFVRALNDLAALGGSSTSVWSTSDAAASGLTLTNGGLTVSNPNVNYRSVRGTISRTSGKYYVEYKTSTGTAAGFDIISGLASSSFNPTTYLGGSDYSGGFDNVGFNFTGLGFTDISSMTVDPLLINDVLGLAVDLAAGKIWLARNNVWFNSGNPATGASPMMAIVAPALGLAYFPGFTVPSPSAGNWTLQSTTASQKYLPPVGFQAWDGGPVTVASSVWSAADATANGMALSNGGLTVTNPAVSTYATVRGTISHTAGQYYVEMLAVNGTVNAGSNDVMFGVADASFTPTTYLGHINYSVGLDNVASGTFASSGFTANVALPSVSPVPANDVFALAVDLTAGKLWIARNNVWASGNPATGTAPTVTIAAPALGLALFPGFTAQGSNGGSWTLQSTAASQKYLPPVGFQAWDGGPVTVVATTMNPSDQSGLTFSNGNLTIASANGANPNTARSTTTKTTGKWHIEFTAVSADGTTDSVGFGIGSSAMNLTLFPGSDNFGAGIVNSTFTTFNAHSADVTIVAPSGTFTTGDVIAVELDLNAQLFWYQNVTSGPHNWNASGTANPATGVGGLSFSLLPTSTPYYIAAGVWPFTGTASITVNFGSTAFALSPSSGFSAWG